MSRSHFWSGVVKSTSVGNMTLMSTIPAEASGEVLYYQLNTGIQIEALEFKIQSTSFSGAFLSCQERDSSVVALSRNVRLVCIAVLLKKLFRVLMEAFATKLLMTQNRGCCIYPDHPKELSGKTSVDKLFFFSFLYKSIISACVSFLSI